MKKIKKAEKWNIPFEMQKNAYNVRIISFLAFFCICLIAISLVAQIFLSKRIVSEKMLGETAAQRAGMFEEVFDKAKKYLENIKAHMQDEESGITFTSNTFDSEGRFFKSVDMKKKRMLFSDDTELKSSGMFFEDDLLNMYLVLDGENLLVGEIDAEYLIGLAELSGSYGDIAEHILFDSVSGKIFINTGAEYGFDGTRIGFLKDFDFENSNGANRMFSRISKNLSGYTVIKNALGHRFSFAYEPVNGEGLYLLQFLPKSNLENVAFRGTAPFFAGIILLIGGALLFTVWIFFVTKKIAYDTAAEIYNGNVMKILLMQMAESSLAYMFVYDRKSDSVTVYRDRDGLHTDGLVIDEGLEYVEHHYKHLKQDIRRLKNALAISGPKKSIKLELLSAVGDGSEQVLLEYTLRAVKNESDGKTDAVVCTVIERSDESEQQEDKGASVTEPDNSIYNTTGIEVLLQRNSWRFLWNNEKSLKNLDYGTEIRGDYDGDVEKNIAPFVMSKDRYLFVSTLSRLNLIENYRNGNTDMCIKYRLNTGDGIYEYRALDIHMYRDAKTDEIKANLYARHLGKV